MFFSSAFFFPTNLFAGGGDPKPVVLANATFYDGFVEKVCMDMGITCCSQSEKQANFATGLSLVKDHLLDLWKRREGVMEKKTPRYQADPPQHEMPLDPSEPELKLCSLLEGVLVLPRDIRTEFMSDPVRSPEWRKIVQEFDRCFGSHAPATPAAAASGTEEAAAAGGSDFNWSTVFPSEVREKAAWHEKYDAQIKGKCQWCPQLTAYLVDPGKTPEGQPIKYMLFVEASEDYTAFADDAFLSYGAGSWLLDSKVDSYLEENQHGYKGVMCKFTSDLDPVTFEDRLVFKYNLQKFVC